MREVTNPSGGIGLANIDNLRDQGLVPIVLAILVYAIVTGLVISWMDVEDKRVEGNLVDAA